MKFPLNLRALSHQFANIIIDAAVKEANGSHSKAAKLLGMNRTTLVERLRKRGLIDPTRWTRYGHKGVIMERPSQAEKELELYGKKA